MKPAQKTFLTVIAPKDEVSRGEKAKVYVFSAIPDALVNIFVQDGSGKTISETLPLKKEFWNIWLTFLKIKVFPI